MVNRGGMDVLRFPSKCSLVFGISFHKDFEHIPNFRVFLLINVRMFVLNFVDWFSDFSGKPRFFICQFTDV